MWLVAGLSGISGKHLHLCRLRRIVGREVRRGGGPGEVRVRVLLVVDLAQWTTDPPGTSVLRDSWASRSVGNYMYEGPFRLSPLDPINTKPDLAEDWRA